MQTLRAKRPRVVITTTPSIVLGYFLLLIRPWFRFKLISDAHYLGVKAPDGNRVWQSFLNFFNARVDFAIVTNGNHAAYLSGLGTATQVCEDPLPALPDVRIRALASPRAVFLVCSFDHDEPFKAAFLAFYHLKDQGYVLYVSGNFRKADIDISQYPWVNFLGFVSTDEYYEYLRSCTVVMDLTTVDDCLVCGAYEALAAGKALILSRTTALAGYFGSAVQLTDNTSSAIQRSVETACAGHLELERKAIEWVVANRPYMDRRIASLKSVLACMQRPGEMSNVR